MASDAAGIDALFRLPFGEFTSARNGLAARLKAAGRTDEAARVKTLPRPSLTAWAVNQLYWHDRKAFDQLIAAGDRLRKAQASQLRGKGGELRQVVEERRQALGALSTRASAILRDAGHPASPDVMRRITSTLDALGTYGRDRTAPSAGRLTGDVDAPGFEALAALIPRQGGGSRSGSVPRVIPFDRRQRTRKGDEDALDAKAHARVAAARRREGQRALAEARRGAARAEAALRAAAGRAKERERKKEALAARLEKAAADLDSARQEARRIAEEAEEAAQAVADAERAMENL